MNTAFGAVSLVDLVASNTGTEAAKSLKNVIDGNATLKDWENVGKALNDKNKVEKKSGLDIPACAVEINKKKKARK